MRVEVERDGLNRRIIELLNEIESLNFSIKTLLGEQAGERSGRAEAEDKLLSTVKSQGSLKSMANSDKISTPQTKPEVVIKVKEVIVEKVVEHFIDRIVEVINLCKISYRCTLQEIQEVTKPF